MAKIVSGKLPFDESIIFSRKLLHDTCRVPQFYGMPKVHKNKLHIPLRPVVSQCGSLLAVASTYIDHKLQPLTDFLPSYTRNFYQIVKELKNLGTLLTNAILFTSDATNMYGTIHMEQGLPTVEIYLVHYGTACTTYDISVKIIVKIFGLLVRNGIFKFGDIWWVRKKVTPWVLHVLVFMLHYFLHSLSVRTY